MKKIEDLDFLSEVEKTELKKKVIEFNTNKTTEESFLLAKYSVHFHFKKGKIRNAILKKGESRLNINPLAIFSLDI